MHRKFLKTEWLHSSVGRALHRHRHRAFSGVYKRQLLKLSREMRKSLPTFICNPHFKFDKSKVVQRCLFSYRQRYSSSQWSKCCGLTRRSHNATTLTLTLNHFRFVFYRNIQRQRKCLFQSATKIMTQRKSKCLVLHYFTQ